VPIKTIAIEGAEDIFHGVAAGVFTTVVVLVPVMFASGYTEQTMRPLNMMITATILSSLVARAIFNSSNSLLIKLNSLSDIFPLLFSFVNSQIIIPPTTIPIARPVSISILSMEFYIL